MVNQTFNEPFWHVSLLYIYRPNLINKRLLGAKLERLWHEAKNEPDLLNDLIENKLMKNETITINQLNHMFESCNDKNLHNLLLDNRSLNKFCSEQILVLRKLFRKISLKSLLNSNNTSNCDQDQSANNNSNNIEYDLICLWPSLNKFSIIPINFNTKLDDDDDENSNHVHINKRNCEENLPFSLKLMIDDNVNIVDDDGKNFHLELSFLDHNNNENYYDQQHRNDSQSWLKNVFKNKFERWILQQQQQQQHEQNFICANNDNNNNNNKQKSFTNSYNDNDSNNNNNKYEGSIRNISVENYCENYNRLKQKYVQPLMKIWTKIENTDPIKFIYEDIAIAAYLITLWNEIDDEQHEPEDKFDHSKPEHHQQQRSKKRKQTFADIGCGNGLLVYMLTQEGYDGYGIDLRRRNIWSEYNNHIDNSNELYGDKYVRLIEMKIDLFKYENIDYNFDLPQQCDWLIGNHSDELTPWILFMAAQQNQRTNVFLLPCCCYNFDGFKFQRNNNHTELSMPTTTTTKSMKNKSQYQCYIDFLEHLGYQFGFEKCQRDKLRIPSTKRICLIYTGRQNNNDDHYYYSESMISNIDNNNDHKTLKKQTKKSIESLLLQNELDWKQKRIEIVRKYIEQNGADRKRNKNVRLRDTNEPIRNCTRIDQKIKQEIINRLTNVLILKQRQQQKTYDRSSSSSLSSLSFDEAMKLLMTNNDNNDNNNNDRNIIKIHLKNQCGGLQTFIRNHKHIFAINVDNRIEFQSKDYLRLNPNNSNASNRNKSTKECWFYRYHPDGCPLLNDECRFKHILNNSNNNDDIVVVND